jgi:hypothetical protein
VCCRGRLRCAACVVAVAFVAPRVLSRSRSLRRVGVAVTFVTPCVTVVVAVVVPRGAAAAVIVTGPQKRKLVEKRENKTYKQADAVRAAARGTATRCHRGR